MDLLNLGAQSRKTGFKPKKNLRKDKYDMEDIDEFFAEEDNNGIQESSASGSVTSQKSAQLADGNSNLSGASEGRLSGSARSGLSSSTLHSTPSQNTNFNNFARKINFTDAEADSFHLSPISLVSKSSRRKNKRSPLRSPLHETEERESPDLYFGDDMASFGDSAEFDDDYKESQNLHDEDRDMSLSPMPLSPIKIRQNPSTSKNNKTKSQVGRPKSSNFGSSITKNMALHGNKTKRKPAPKIQNESTPGSDDMDRSSLSPPIGVPKHRVLKKYVSKEMVTKPSPLPSPPPDGLRRSKRVKIPPLAYWRNERIVYTRAVEDNDLDPDTTLANDIRKIPLQEIKEVVHIEEMKSPPPPARKRGRPRKADSAPKPQKVLDYQNVVYDYESDPEIDGSEWFKDKSLSLKVFEGPNDERSLIPIAWAPGSGNFEQPKNSGEIEDFKVASLFGNDRDFTAGGLIEFPYGGFKGLRNSSSSVYIFHVVKGLIEVTLNEDKFVVTRGCSFQVPRSNNFAFKNLSQDVSKLFFVQSKKVVIESEEY